MATQQDKINSGALATLVAVSAFAMVGVTLAVTALTRQELGIAQGEREDRGSNEVRELNRQQLAKLEAGVPIQEAMKRVVGKLAHDPNSATPPGAPVAFPVAAGGAAGAAAVSTAGSGGGALGAGGAAGGAVGAGGAIGGATTAGAAGATSGSQTPPQSPANPGRPAPGFTGKPLPALSASPARPPTPAALPGNAGPRGASAPNP